MNIEITTPINKEELKKLKAGDSILLSGVIYTARDAAHERMVSDYKNGIPFPIDLSNQSIYYAGPCPAKPGEVIGSCGPTTSGRMDKYTPLLLDNGLSIMIGKGMRSKEVTDAIIRNGCIYLGAIGGAGALISQCIKKAEVICYEDLGTEAIRKLEIEKLPLIVLTDSLGNDLYEIGQKEFLKK